MVDGDFVIIPLTIELILYQSLGPLVSSNKIFLRWKNVVFFN